MTDQPTPAVPVYDRAAWETYRRVARCECTAPDPADCAIQHRPWPSPWMCPCHYLSVVPTAAELAAAKAHFAANLTALAVDPAKAAAAVHADGPAIWTAAAPAEQPDREQLRQRYAEALHAAGGPFANVSPEVLADAVLAVQGTELDRLLERAETAEALLRDLLHPDLCDTDSGGFCQAHGWRDPDGCPYARAREHLAAADQLTADEARDLADDTNQARCPREDPHAPHTWTWQEDCADCPGLRPGDPPPATLRVPAPTTRAGLRQQYADAIREELGDGPWDVIAHRAADAVMAVRDRELEQARAARDRYRRAWQAAEEAWRNTVARAEQAEDLLRVARETSNRSETARAAAQRELEKSEAALARVRAVIADPRETFEVYDGQVIAVAVVARALDSTGQPTDDDHVYLSTGCRHGNHGYCQNPTGRTGAKKPAECKHCSAKCVCPCHTQPPVAPTLDADQLADGHAVDDEEPDLGPAVIWPSPPVPEPCDAASPWGDAHACYHPAGHEGPHEAADGCNWRNTPEADRA